MIGKNLKLRKYLRFIAEIVLFLAILWGIQSYQSRSMLKNVQDAPAFSLKDTQSQIVNSKDFEGKKILIYFFAPWCQVCRLSADNLIKIKETFNPEKYALVTIALSYESTNEVIAFAEKYRLPSPVLLGNEQIMDDFKISAFPSYYIVSEQNKILSQQVGYSTYLGLKLRLLYL